MDVARIGLAHGYELDRGHIKDFLAAAGVGMTGQYVEQFGRRLIGGLLEDINENTDANVPWLSRLLLTSWSWIAWWAVSISTRTWPLWLPVTWSRTTQSYSR